MKRYITSLALALLLCFASPLFAADAPVSKQQAVAIAQDALPGRVLSVRQGESNNTAVYRVKMLAKDGSVRIVVIDANSGEVISR